MSRFAATLGLLLQNTGFGNRFVKHKIIPGNPGNFSVIFEAEDSNNIGHRVFIKAFNLFESDPYRKLSFYREAELLKKVRGKKRCLWSVEDSVSLAKIKTASAVGNIEQDVPYIATEHCPDGVNDFFYLIRTRPLWERLKIFKDIVLSIEAMHSCNISHRDIKPDNFRIAIHDGEKVVVAIDYGTAHEDGQEHIYKNYADYGAPGELYYSSPELISGLAHFQNFGKAADIYALGIVLEKLMYSQSNYTERAIQFIQICNQIKNRLINVPQSNQIDFFKDAWSNVIDSTQLFPSNIPALDAQKNEHCLLEGINRIHSMMINPNFEKRLKEFSEIHKRLDTLILAAQRSTLYARIALLSDQKRIAHDKISDRDFKYKKRVESRKILSQKHNKPKELS